MLCLALVLLIALSVRPSWCSRVCERGAAGGAPAEVSGTWAGLWDLRVLRGLAGVSAGLWKAVAVSGLQLAASTSSFELLEASTCCCDPSATAPSVLGTVPSSSFPRGSATGIWAQLFPLEIDRS